MPSAKELVDLAIRDRDVLESAQAAVKAVQRARDPQLALQLAVEVPRADRLALEAVVIAAADPRCAYMWAMSIPGANLTALAPIVGRSPFYATEFERHFDSLKKPVRASVYGVRVGNANYRSAEVLEVLPGDRKVLVRFANSSRAWVPTARVVRIATLRGCKEI